MTGPGIKTRNRRILLIVFGAVLAMLALAYASVPLYRLFCQMTGFGGTTATATGFPEQVLPRAVTIRFNADHSRALPWDFTPEQREVTVKLGEKGLAAYRALNRGDAPVTGTAIYNVTPPKAGKYFHKVQCFCFGEQTLNPGEKVSMPVLFFIDPAMADDPNMDDVKVITLSYTFYKTGAPELERALEQFYNEPAAKPAQTTTE